MNTIKAIETRYKGYRFRSRLEARWAVFFDELGLQWEYEPEGFELSDGVLYLPDFRVTGKSGQIYYEIKPAGTPNDEKVRRFNEDMWEKFQSESSAWTEGDDSCEPPPPCIQLTGDPVDQIGLLVHYENGGSEHVILCPRCGAIDHPACGFYTIAGDVLIGCEPCDFSTPGGGGNPYEPGIVDGVLLTPHKGMILLSIHGWNIHNRIVNAAAIKARSARFEHGECGALA